MAKFNNTAILAVLVIAAVLTFVYTGRKSLQIKNLEQQIQKLYTEKAKLKKYEAKIAAFNKALLKTDTASFIEDIYLCAQRTGLKNHEAVTTAGSENIAQIRKGAEKGGGFKKQAIKISAEGQYRETAEFIRELQNLEALKRITSLEMKPADGKIKTNIVVELISVER